jgi:hypothetical protein
VCETKKTHRGKTAAAPRKETGAATRTMTSMRRPGWRVAVASAAILLLNLMKTTTAKVVSGSVTLNNQTQWAYLTKFSYSLGSGNFTLDVKSSNVSSRCIRYTIYTERGL